jgi:hypothetical protein
MERMAENVAIVDFDLHAPEVVKRLAGARPHTWRRRVTRYGAVAIAQVTTVQRGDR